MFEHRKFAAWPTFGAVCAAFAALALIGMAFLPRPFAPMDHLSILLRTQPVDAEQLVAYRAYVSNNLTLDSLYLFAHAFVWLALAGVVSVRSVALGFVVLVFGLAGASLDFLENEMRWAAFDILLAGGLPAETYVAVWRIAQAFSFWFLFLAAAFAGAGAMRNRAGRLFSAWSLAGAVVAAFSYKAGHFYAFLWLIFWHLLAAHFLWANRAADESAVTSG